MLQSIRDRTQGWITNTVIGLLIIVFTLWGIHGYLELNAGRNNKVVAKVAGQTLLQSDFDKAYQRAYQQTRDRFGEKFSNDGKMAKELRRQILREWETTQVLFQAALQSKYRISQSLIDSVLLQIPAFQSEGRFSIEKFYDVLHALNYTKLEFLGDIKKTLLINQVKQGITQSEFALPQDISNYIKYRDQKRDFAYLIIPHSRFSEQKNLPDFKIFAYYQKNKLSFSQPEQASIEYIELSFQDEKKFLENRGKLANLTYMHPDSLAIAANKLGLEIHSTAFFDKAGGKKGLSKNSKILAATFSQDVLQGNNSPVIDINSNTAIVLRIKKYQPAGIQPFNNEVREKIKVILNKQLAISKARQFGENLLRNLEKMGSTPINLESKKLKWKFIKQANRYDKKLNKEVINTVFTLTPPNKHILALLSMKGFSLENGDYVLVRLMAVYDEASPPLLNNSTKKLYREEIAKNLGQLDYTLYTNNLLKKVKLIP
ncbi:SurA N-terminal domain-containing protein [Rickettsiella endosymbiont of Litargus connexus]|jgi:peptidyl-prolyl cis-trans isomerase D|uniref:peptidylprolyl isomerase n=1 Tax=Rickettsiella endosymbiont of Litargus connexus TaxID=3066237 RepID=UPI00376F2F5C